MLDDKVWDEACKQRLRATDGSLHRVIRFYISIEDAECTVERDLAVYRDHILEHRTDSDAFLDECLLVKLCGPKTRLEFDDGAADSSVELTPFSRECASLWLVLYGCRGGHYNKKATAAAKLKRGMRPDGLFRRTTLGVFAAARLAVGDARRKSRQTRSSGSGLHSGAGTSDSTVWNANMDAYRKLSIRNNIKGCTETRAKPGSAFLNPPSVGMGLREGARKQVLPLMLPHNPAVAIVGVSSEEMCHLLQCRCFVGVHRCEKADLAIVPDPSMLHDVDALAADVDLVVSFLYMVSLGMDVATITQLAIVRGVPSRLSSDQRVLPVAAVKTEYTFFVGAELRREGPDFYQALSFIADSPRSKYSVSKKPAAEEDDIVFNSLRDVVVWASSVRRVQQFQGPKAFTADGVAMPA